ncbi:hypothetical protein B0H10DRAFT_477149 [Mycena sp. CBHHK59/15]|nr:hypothetical protein B0H10DRAFT_477149 [Mycena sp. CBHHK59/15]
MIASPRGWAFKQVQWVFGLLAAVLQVGLNQAGRRWRANLVLGLPGHFVLRKPFKSREKELMAQGTHALPLTICWPCARFSPFGRDPKIETGGKKPHPSYKRTRGVEPRQLLDIQIQR